MTDNLQEYIRSIPDFPKKGIVFKDITTLLQDKTAYSRSLEMMAQPFLSSKIDKVVSVESRGFIFGSALAYMLKAGFVPVRKPKKLPFNTYFEEYTLEYGTDRLEIHTDAITKGEKVLIVDDLLATGGTLDATAKLVNKLGGDIVSMVFLIELTFLKGRERLRDFNVFSLISYDAE